MRMSSLIRSKRAWAAGAAMLALLGAGAAEASGRLHTMQVAAPDGSVIHVQYAGGTAPHVTFVPVADESVAADPFEAMERISAAMDAQMSAMMYQAAALQQQAAQQQAVQGQAHTVAAHADGAPGLVLAGNVPQGVHVTYYSTSTDANGCTRSVSYSSDGSTAKPKVTEAASDGCEAAAAHPAAIPVKATRSDAPVPAGPPPRTAPQPAAPPPGTRA